MLVILLGATLIGITLGMLGSGGSAITVPVLVYLVGHSAKVSIAESLAIVGLISIAAAIPYGRRRQIDWPSVFFFGIPGMIGTYLGAWLGGIASDVTQLVVFGCVLLVASYSMLRKRPTTQAGKTLDEPFVVDAQHAKHPIPLTALEGTAVGALAGFVGVGGGFLIVPALVMLGRLPMRMAIGTSLVIIAAQSAVGFIKYQRILVEQNFSVDATTIALFVAIGLVGAFVGRHVNQRLDQQTLRRVFAVFLLLLGTFVIAREGSHWYRSKVPASTAADTSTQQHSGRAPLNSFPTHLT